MSLEIRVEIWNFDDWNRMLFEWKPVWWKLLSKSTTSQISWAGRLSREVEEEITPSRIKEIREKVEKSVKSLHDKIESAEVSEVRLK